MPLRYAPFLACTAIVNAYHDVRPLRWGARGSGVRLLQAGLRQLGYPVPSVDGIFGRDTTTVLEQYQEKHRAYLDVDGIAGKKTIGLIDAQLVMLAKPPPAAPPPKPRPPISAVYQLGTQDPAYVADKGAGGFKSAPTQATYAALASGIVAGLPVAYFYVGDDATKHLWHYFLCSGGEYTVDLEGMVSEVAEAAELYEREVWLAKRFVEELPPGRHDIVAQQTREGYNREPQNRNWYYALGGYHAWGRGSAVVEELGGQRRCSLDFEFKVRDRYNWDNGKYVDIGDYRVTDKFMGEFHRQGLGREFDCVGSFSRKFTWRAGTQIPRASMHASAGRA